MNYLRHLDDVVLQEMLESYNSRYRQLIEDGTINSPMFYNCRDMIMAINHEIKHRKENADKSFHDNN